MQGTPPPRVNTPNLIALSSSSGVVHVDPGAIIGISELHQGGPDGIHTGTLIHICGGSIMTALRSADVIAAIEARARQSEAEWDAWSASMQLGAGAVVVEELGGELEDEELEGVGAGARYRRRRTARAVRLEDIESHIRELSSLVGRELSVVIGGHQRLAHAIESLRTPARGDDDGSAMG